MRVAINIPDWILATQPRRQFVDMTPESLERALKHYARSQCPPEAAGVPEQPKSVLAPQQAPRSSLPAYLVRAQRDRAARGKGAHSAPSPANQPSLF